MIVLSAEYNKRNFEIVLMQLSHTDLVELAKILGYNKNLQGICNGFSVMLAQAVLLEQEEMFFIRLRLIEQYKGNFNQLAKEIERVKQQVKAGQTLNQVETSLLEIIAFFDGIAIAHCPLNQREVFSGKYISQLNIEAVYAVMGSKALETFNTPVGIVSNESHVFTPKELTNYFHGLEDTLSKTNSIIPLLFYSNNHAVLASYDKTKKIWRYVDSNLLNQTENGYLELTSEQLAATIRNDLYGITNLLNQIENLALISEQLAATIRNALYGMQFYMAFNLAAISNTIDANDQLLFNAFNSKYPVVSEHATRYDINQMGLLSMACQYGHLRTVQQLLQFPIININKGNKDGSTALWFACEKGHIELVRLLLQQSGIDINQINNKGASPFYMACTNGHIEIVRLLMQQEGIVTDNAPLGCPNAFSTACLFGYVEIVKLFLQPGKMDINQTFNLNEALHIAFIKEHVEVIRQLLQQKGIDANLTQFNLILQGMSAQKQSIIRLYFRIKEMEVYGNSLYAIDRDKAHIVLELVQALHKKLDQFYDEFSSKQFSVEQFNQFATEFKHLLHSQDASINEYRALWKTIVANILLALTGIGLLAIVVKTAFSVVKSPTQCTWHSCLFFSKMACQENIERVEESFAYAFNC